jgi:ketopantoate hydroxymethyltransferase
MEGRKLITQALTDYASSVRERKFPGDENSF